MLLSKKIIIRVKLIRQEAETIETKAIDELSIKFKWAIRKSMKDLVEVDSKFKEFREEYINELRTKYFMDGSKAKQMLYAQDDPEENVIKGEKIKESSIEYKFVNKYIIL